MTPGARKALAAAAQLALAALVLWFAASRITPEQWATLRTGSVGLRPDWTLVALSALVVLGAYALLVQTWRVALGAWDAGLPFWEAARIWSISNLGRYVPGKVWQIGAMGMMAQRRGVSPVAAVGSSLVVTLITTAVGFGVVFATGAHVLEAAVGSRGAVRAASAAFVLVGVALALAPAMLPWLADRLRRLTGRDLRIPRLPARAVWAAAAGSAIAWVLFGVAFRLLTAGLLGDAAGATSAYIAVFTGSYLVGYVVLFMPGGLVFRESALTAGMTALGLATLPEAALLAIASRIWLTILELAPGLFFLVRDAARRSPNSAPRDVQR